MIAVEKKGRLGNQLFQFAFGMEAAARLGTAFAMPDQELLRLFTLGGSGARLGRRARALQLRAGNRLRPYPVVSQDSFAGPEELFARAADRRIYAGYFQSERYFAGVKEQLPALFSLRPEHRRRFEDRYPHLLGVRYVCCHVRRTDYHGWYGGVALPASYYRDALEALSPSSGVPIVFVGDDFEDLPEELADVPGVRWERNDEAVDFQLVLHADSVVTSNSSFSWWGAYLNASADKQVVAPRHWLGFKEGREIPGDVVPGGWEQIAVRQGRAAAPH